MVIIICWNPECPAKKFDWYEPMGCAPALFNELGAQEFSAVCPHCRRPNFFFLKCVEVKPVGGGGGGMDKEPNLGPRKIPISEIQGAMSTYGGSGY